MKTLPDHENCLVVRTGPADNWAALCAAVAAPAEPDSDPFAYYEFVDDPAYEGATPEQLAAAMPADSTAPVLVVADERALTEPGFPMLAVNLEPEDDDPVLLRASPTMLQYVVCNLEIGNGWFTDYASYADDQGGVWTSWDR